MGHSHSHCHSYRTEKIKTFRPEISSVDIMMGKVSSCLLPGGGDGDDECDVMEQITLCSPAASSLIILIFCLTSAPQPTSVITETQTNLPIHLPSRVGDNGTDGPGNHPQLTLLSSASS